MLHDPNQLPLPLVFAGPVPEVELETRPLDYHDEWEYINPDDLDPYDSDEYFRSLTMNEQYRGWGECL